MPYVPEHHDEFLAHEVKLSYTERMERIEAMKAKGYDMHDTEHRLAHEIEEHGYEHAGPPPVVPPSPAEEKPAS
jgi:hypothetical protein